MTLSIDQEFFARPATTVGPQLLGLHLTCQGVTLRITEIEAYEGALDPGSHGFRGRTARNDALFGPPGTVYVYLSYGIHKAVNLVCGTDGEAAGCLVRAGEVVEGIELAHERRDRPGKSVSEINLARGPGNVGQAVAADFSLNGVSLFDSGSPISISAPQGWSPATHRAGPRVGVSGIGGDGDVHPWRYWLDGDPTVSTYRPGKIPAAKSDSGG